MLRLRLFLPQTDTDTLETKGEVSIPRSLEMRRHTQIMCLKALNKNRNHFCIPHQSLSQVGVVSAGTGARGGFAWAGCAHANHPGDSPPVFRLFQSKKLTNQPLAHFQTSSSRLLSYFNGCRNLY